MSAALSTGFLAASDHADWNAFVATSPQGSVYSHTDYLAALAEATGATFRVLAARRGDEIQGGVTLFEQPRAGGIRIAPRPLLFYNGLVLRNFATRYPSQRTARELEATAALEAELAAAGYSAVTLKSRSPFIDARSFMAKGWIVRPGYSYVVPIRDLDAAWNRVEQNLRRLVKRCANDGLTVTEDSDFDSFLRMHVETAVRKGLEPYLPDAAFGRFFQRLSALGLCRLYHARLPSGRSVSAQLVLTGKHPVSHTVSAATDPDHLQSGATAFLRWKAFEALSAQGYEANDLTDAALNSVTHFKSQLGGALELLLICERTPAPPAGWMRRLRSKVGGLVRR